VKHPRLCHDTDNISTNTDGLNVTSHLIDNNQYGDEELLLDPSYINDIEERTLETKSKRVRKKQASVRIPRFYLAQVRLIRSLGSIRTTHWPSGSH